MKENKIKQILDPNKIRNISIISHVDHGKTTLSDYLLSSGGMIPKKLAGNLRALDYLPEEQRRGITIETSYASYFLKLQNDNYLINLIDTPGHVDFSGKVAESMRLVDGAIILVDAVEGIMAQTKTVLRQAVNEGIKLILFINKIDRLITELKLPMDKIKERIEQIISEIGLNIKLYGNQKYQLPNFTDGTVLIGSAIDGWALDINYVKNGGKLSDIISLYSDENKLFSEKTELTQILNIAITDLLPSPLEGQQIKFPKMLKRAVNDKTEQILTSCNSNLPTVILIGRVFRAIQKSQIGYIVRILSGKINRGSVLFSSISNEKVRIVKIFWVTGKTIRDAETLEAGQIGGVILSKSSYPGVILKDKSIEKIELTGIDYVQEPVVAISIEPNIISEISKVQHELENIANATPGIEFEINKETGELLALGVGTLQLEILTNELKSLNYDIVASKPKILKFEMPIRFQLIISNKWDNFEVELIDPSDESIMKGEYDIFSDSRGNKLYNQSGIDKDSLDGFIEVFRQSVRISPNSGNKVRNLILALKKYPDKKTYSTYEYGMILGSNMMRNIFEGPMVAIHEPFYLVSFALPDTYLGSTLHELQRINAIIDEIQTNNFETIIKAKISVEEATSMADNIRQITDGNAFWSYNSVEFYPIRN